MTYQLDPSAWTYVDDYWTLNAASLGHPDCSRALRIVTPGLEFLSMDSATGLLEISPTLPSQIGTHSVEIGGYYGNYDLHTSSEAIVTIQVTVEPACEITSFGLISNLIP